MDKIRILSTLILLLISPVSLAGRFTDESIYIDWNDGRIFWLNLFTVTCVVIVLFYKYMLSEKAGENRVSILSRWYRNWAIAASFIIVLAWMEMPSDFYIYLLRPVLFGVAIIAMIFLYFEDRQNEWYFWILAAFALLHNPIIPVFFGKGYKPLWVILNLILFSFIWFLHLNIFKEIKLKYQAEERKMRMKWADKILQLKEWDDIVNEYKKK